MSEERGALDLPAEAIAVVREAGVGGVFVWFAFVFLACCASIPLFAFGEMLAELAGRHQLYVRDALDTTTWEPVGNAARLTIVAGTVAFAMVGPLLPDLARRRLRPTLAGLTLLVLPSVCACAVIADACAWRPAAYNDPRSLRVAAACLWLLIATPHVGLAAPVMFLEERRGLRVVLRRAVDLARGRRVLVALTSIVPGVMVLGSVFQLVVGMNYWSSSAAQAATALTAIVALVAAPVLASVLKVAAWRIATQGAP